MNTSSEKSKQHHPPVLNARVHRIRDLHYRPAEIVSMSTVSLPQQNHDYVAIGRDDGGIELRAASESFWTIARVPGSCHVVPTVLDWMHETAESSPTLVGGSADGSLFIVDFESSQISSRIASGGGGVFSLTRIKEHGNIIAAGCQDGSVRFFSLRSNFDGSTLECIGQLPSAGSAILSMAWSTVKQHTDGAGQPILDTMLHCGIADGTIRQYHVQLLINVNSEMSSTTLGTVKQSYRMTVGSKGRTTPTRVWALKQLSDGTLVAATSLGKVQFWDTRTGTMTQSIYHNDQDADVLCLAVSKDESAIFASGVDSKVIYIEKQRNHEDVTDITSPWRSTNAQRPHTHDVKAIVTCSQPTKGGGTIETLITGGVDTKLCLYHMNDFARRRPRVLYPWPSFSPVKDMCREARLLIMQRNDRVEIYAIRKVSSDNSDHAGSRSTMVGKVDIKSISNLVSSTISADGGLLAICDASNLYVFQLTHDRNRNEEIVQTVPHQLDTVAKLNLPPLVALKFIDKHKLLATDCLGQLHSCDFDTSNSIKHSFVLRKQDLGKQEQHQWPSLPKTTIMNSENGEFIATVAHRVENAITVFKKDKGGKFQLDWTLPSVHLRPSATTFLQIKSTRIALSTSSSQVYLFDLKEKKLCQWSEDQGFPLKSVPTELATKRIVPVRLTVNPSKHSKLIVGSFGMFCVMDLKTKLPERCRVVPNKHMRRKRKARQDEEPQDYVPFIAAKKPNVEYEGTTNCTMCLRYNSMIFLDFIASNEMVVVEQPWLDVVATFPPALQRRIYGLS